MPTYVAHKGQLIEKHLKPQKAAARSSLPAPAVHGFETYASPIDGKPISSHRQRDKDLHTSGSYDPRDTPAAFKKARHARTRSNKQLAAKSS